MTKKKKMWSMRTKNKTKKFLRLKKVFSKIWKKKSRRKEWKITR